MVGINPGVSFKAEETEQEGMESGWQAEEKVETPPCADSSKRRVGDLPGFTEAPQRFCAESLAGKICGLGG